jgi:hypothetical protein
MRLIAWTSLWLSLALLGCTGGAASSPEDTQTARVDADPTTDAASTTDAAPTEDVTPSAPLRALFIGNSFTYQHDVPGLVRAIGAATPGGEVVVEMIALPGEGLSGHASNPDTMARIRSGDFDVIVIQGQSFEPIVFPGSFEQGAQLLRDAAQGAGAGRVWFATWARREGHPDYDDIGGLLNPARMTFELEQGYVRVAAPYGDPVALVGAAFLLAHATFPDVTLHASDGVHTTPEGALLAGCVLFYGLTGRTPQVPSPPPLGLAADVAEGLCALATQAQPTVEPWCDDTVCGDACVNLSSDRSHCGGCDRPCAGQDPCLGGVCGCLAPLSACDGACYDLTTDRTHCGACDNVCPLGNKCVDGACGCQAVGEVRLGQALGDISALTVANADCTPTDNADPQLAGLPCRQAAHSICASASDCFDSGLPPPTSGFYYRFDTALCVRADLHSVDYATLQALAPACVEVSAQTGQACVTAISLYCASLGAVSGFGPVNGDEGGALTVACLPNAVIVQTTMEELSAVTSGCVPDSVTCQSAARSLCIYAGYIGGFGPIDLAGDEAHIVCLSP